MLKIEKVSIKYDEADSLAVNNVSLCVKPGEIIVILGPSGCGKSSLLRAVAGLEPLSGGKILWNNLDIAKVPTYRRHFGLMFQDALLFPHRNVAKNVAYGLETYRWPRAEKAHRVQEILNMVGIPDYGSRDVTTLSGGQAQRVSLARALANKPEILIIDEPLAALDRDLRLRLASEVAAIVKRTAVGAIYVTHDLEEAELVADTIVRMEAGRISHRLPRP